MDQRDERTWTEAWEAAYPERATAAGGDAPPAATKQRRRGPRTRSVALATGMLVLGLAPFGVAATGDVLREGQRNGTATRETEIIADEAASSGAKGGYATRQSNKSNSGGGAIYGCRSRTGAGNDPCLRSNNLSTGSAFQFNTVGGESAGTITAGAGGDAKRPFTTNATGVATGLNADRVDGVDAASLRTRWALINEQGLIDSQSGGFTILDRYQTNNNIYIDAGAPLDTKGITATIALQNQLDTDGSGSAADNEFGGEISVSRCQIPGRVECAPANSKNVNAFVVSPRNSDGTATGGTPANPRKRFYVVITE